MKCTQCGYFNLPNALACGRCGMDLAHPVASNRSDLGESLYPRRARDRTWRDHVQMRVRLASLPERAPMPPLGDTLRPWLLMTAAVLPGGGHFLLRDWPCGLGLLTAFAGTLALTMLFLHWWVSDLLLWTALFIVCCSVWDVTNRVFPPAADNPEAFYYRRLRLGCLSLGTVAGTLASLYWLAGQWYPIYHLTNDESAPTLRAGDDVTEQRLNWPLQSLRHGDVVVVQENGYPIIERLLGLPGDHLVDAGGVLLVNGHLADRERQPLNAAGWRAAGAFDVIVPPGMVYLWLPQPGVYDGEGQFQPPRAFFGSIYAGTVEGRLIAVVGPPSHRRWFP